jgi:hypothetical protein
MKAPRILATAAVTAVILGTAATAYAASPSSGSIGPSDLSDVWAGKHFALGSTPLPGLCNPEQCDYFALSVAVSSSYWKDHTGSASVSISWGSATDNFDLYVYKGGQLLKSSTQPVSTSEAVTLATPSGGYQVLVVPVLVTDSGYSGSARFSSKKNPPPPPPSSPPPGGGGGGGGGGGDQKQGGGGSGGSGGSGSGIPNWYQGPSYFPPSYYGGGTVYFGPQDRTITSRQIYYGSGSPSPRAAGSTRTQSKPVALTVPQLPRYIWLLIPLGMVALAVIAYTVFEPEPELAEDPLPEPEWRSRHPSLTPAPVALAGVTVRAALRLGRAVRRGFSSAIARRLKGGSGSS